MTPAGAQMTAGAPPSAAALLAALPATVDTAVVRDGPRFVVAAAPDAVRVASGPEALDELDRLPPGWWAGFLSYELGGAVERVTPRRRPDAGDGEPTLPDLVLARFPVRLVLDPVSGRSELHGHGEARDRLAHAVEVARAGAPVPASPALPRWHSSLDRVVFEQRVAMILEHIGAGDCYQVNLTRGLTCDHAVDPVGLFNALDRCNPSPHGALLRFGSTPGAPALAVVSASPERFLSWRGRDAETRPIKGTGADPTTLAASAKDRAENVMIVDLARNDFGRVCEPGSVVVPALCELEAHPGLHHLVSTVRGQRRDGTGIGALVRATFPPASVTGAPKPRVMQIIEDLEPVPRGVYCGAVGWIDTERDGGDLNVAIRTFTVAHGRTHLGVGAGIVADSEPAAEWAETELKAARLLTAAGTDLADSRAVALTGANR
ncbi:MAG TPA: anthranilate synthase component I family protein [Acidimicrobiia bacterium]|nr:anthranilate synthase component I family protein [Acidimicrobiia bacterium]